MEKYVIIFIIYIIKVKEKIKLGASTNHQLIIGNIYHLFRLRLEEAFKEKGEDLETQPVIILAPYNVFFKKPEIQVKKYSLVLTPGRVRTEPDLSLFSIQSEAVIGPGSTVGSPELIIEVLSPATRDNDLDDQVGKKRIYEYNMVKEYWVVDPEDKSLTVFELGEDKLYKQILVINLNEHSNNAFRSKTFPSIEVTLKEIFDIQEV